MEQSENFYVQKKDYWLKFFHSIFDNKKVHKLVVEKYIEPQRIPEIKLKIQQQFEELLPQLPDFGRRKIDRSSIDMIKSTQSLAFYQVLKGEGFPVRTIGQIMFEIAEVYYADQNPLFKYYMRMQAYSPFYHRRLKKKYEERKDSPHPEDYHAEFVEGDGQNLLFGFNYTNCAAFYLLQKHNALEIHPYLCLCDYPMTRAFNIGFNRDQNIAIGGEMCTFRIYRNYPTPRGWPPEEVPEYKDFNFAA